MNEVSKVIVFIVILVLFAILVLIILERNELFLEYKTANNNKKYGIQEKFAKSDEAVEILAKLHNHMENFVRDLSKKMPDDPRVVRLVKGFNRVEIEEAPNEDDSTSYTINKGDLMAICLRHKKDDHPFHDFNTLLFVIIHEMAHIASVSEGHNEEFIKNFKFLLKEAKSLGYYDPVDYRSNPITYCGLKVTNNPYY